MAGTVRSAETEAAVRDQPPWSLASKTTIEVVVRPEVEIRIFKCTALGAARAPDEETLGTAPRAAARLWSRPLSLWMAKEPMPPRMLGRNFFCVM